MKKMKGLMQAAIVIVYILLVWTIIIPLIATWILYRYLFDKRCDKTEGVLTAADYPNLDSATRRKACSPRRTIPIWIVRRSG